MADSMKDSSYGSYLLQVLEEGRDSARTHPAWRRPRVRSEET